MPYFRIFFLTLILSNLLIINNSFASDNPRFCPGSGATVELKNNMVVCTYSVSTAPDQDNNNEDNLGVNQWYAYLTDPINADDPTQGGLGLSHTTPILLSAVGGTGGAGGNASQDYVLYEYHQSGGAGGVAVTATSLQKLSDTASKTGKLYFYVGGKGADSDCGGCSGYGGTSSLITTKVLGENENDGMNLDNIVTIAGGGGGGGGATVGPITIVEEPRDLGGKSDGYNGGVGGVIDTLELN